MKKLPINYLEIEEIYSKTLGQDNIKSIAITSANQSEGVSTIAYTLSKRSESEGKKTLLVELNMLHPELSDRSNHVHSEWQPMPESASKCVIESVTDVEKIKKNTANLEVLTAPRTNIIHDFRNQDKYVKLLEYWNDNYDAIIFDTSPVNAINQYNIPAENICASADGAIIVVLAGETRDADFNKAVERLKKNKVNILGIVFNDLYNPRLSDEIIRETERFDKLFPKTMAKIKRMVRESSFFNIEI